MSSGLIDLPFWCKHPWGAHKAPSIVGLTWDENDTARRFNLIDACGMPMLSNPNLLFIAQVAA